MNHYQSADLHKACGLSFHAFNQDGLQDFLPQHCLQTTRKLEYIKQHPKNT